MRPGWAHPRGATAVSRVVDEGAAERRRDCKAHLPSDSEDARLTDLVRRRIGAVLILVSLVPIAVLGLGAWAHLREVHLQQTLQRQRSAATTHASAIDFYLAERLRALQLGARAHGFDRLADRSQLRALFDHLQQTYPNAFVDLGVIDSQGRHVAYVGQYRLADKNYRNEAWFRTVTSRGTYISDVFLGFRKVPHCVIAVRQTDAAQPWILRATINSSSLQALVRAGAADPESDAYLLNQEGILQTPSRTRRVLERAGAPDGAVGSESVDARTGDDQPGMVRATASLNEGRWMLVVEQPEARVLKPVNDVARSTAWLLALVLGLAAIATLMATRHLNRAVDRANTQRDRLRNDLIRSARLASLGEMASGLAHEINNPLAVLGAERTNLADLLTDADVGSELMDDVRRSLDRCQRQIGRCADITAKMLQFARTRDTRVLPVSVEPVIREVVDLYARRAREVDVDLRLEISAHLPAVLADQNELEQVLVNLVNNAFYAVDRGGVIVIGAKHAGTEVELSVQDDGCGIAVEDLDLVFQPFFTTKPPGSGTGLGLSVCHGLVSGWGGRIEADSRLGEGTALRVLVRSANADASSTVAGSSTSGWNAEDESVFGESHD